MPRKGHEPNDQRLTVYVPDKSIPGRVIRYGESGMEAQMEREVPRDEWFHFTLHLPGGILAGDLRCIAADDRLCRLQFAALSSEDRERLEPLIEPDM
jgi:hypothetical protein